MNPLQSMKEDYLATEIPDELELVVRKTVQNHAKSQRNRKWLKVSLLAAAVVAGVFVGGVNISPKAAHAFSQVPVLGGVVRLVTIKNFVHHDEGFEATVKIPEIQGMDNTALQDRLNEKYLEEGQKLYADFQAEADELKKQGVQNKALFSGYETKLNNEKLLVIKRQTVDVQASGAQSVKYDTIDKVNKVVVTLPSLFRNGDYVQHISAEIKRQMRQQASSDNEKIYFIVGENGSEDGFKQIDKNQTFYINNEGKLVIVFNEYEVAPGSMGIVEFVIPTNVIQQDLVSNYYVKQ